MLLRRGNAVLSVGFALAGALLLATCSLLSFVHLAPVPAHAPGFMGIMGAYWHRIAMLTSPLVAGYGLVYWGEKTFKRGFLEHLWTEEELVRVRRLLELRLWKVIAVMAVVLWGVLLFRMHTLRGFGLAYLLVLPAQVTGRMLSLIAAGFPRDPSLSTWKSFPRIRSEHWGEDRARS